MEKLAQIREQLTVAHPVESLQGAFGVAYGITGCKGCSGSCESTCRGNCDGQCFFQ